VVTLAVLIRLAENCPDSGTGCTSDEGALQTASNHRAQYRAPGSANRRAGSRADTALVAAMPPVPVTIALAVIVPATAAIAHPVIELIALLSQRRQRSQHQKQKAKEYARSSSHDVSFS
jgi:hypothetical protein